MDAPPNSAHVLAPAKVNLSLRVLGRRDDGYHEVDTVIQWVRFGDEVSVERTEGHSVRIDVSVEDNRSDPGPDRGNLAYLAALRYREAARIDGSWQLRLRKRVPVGAGLGGGSSDAAAVLRLLDHLTAGALERDALMELAAGLGSDVPAFLAGSPLVRAAGRGEIVEPLTALPSRSLLIVVPPVAVGTAGAYAALTRYRGGKTGPDPEPDMPVRHRVREPSSPPTPVGTRSPWADALAAVDNDFTAVVSAVHPDIEDALDSLCEAGCQPVSLSGSGSACFGFLEEGAADSPGSRNLANLGPGWRVIDTTTLDHVPPIEGGLPR